VLVLVAAALGLAAPSLRGFGRSRETADAAARLVALAQFARAQAAAEGRPYRLCVDPESATCWVAARQSGAFVELDCEMGRRFGFPAGSSVRLAGATEEGAGPSYIQFEPDGRTEPATIEITGPAGEVFRVACQSPAERFRVLRPSEGDGS